MPSVSESIVIDRPRADVYAYMIDVANAPLWQTNVISMEAQYEGDPEVGARTAAVGKVAGKKLPVTTEYTMIDPAKAVSFRTVEAPFAFTITWRFEDVDGGTQVTYAGEAPSLGGVFGKLSDPVVTRMFARDIRSNLQNVKDILESEA